MTELLLGLLLTLLALIGFLFNFYIVLALVLTKQVTTRRKMGENSHGNCRDENQCQLQ